ASATVLDATFRTEDLLGRRLTLSYVPFDAEDEETVKSFGGLTRTPPYLIDVRAVLKSGGIVVATGSLPVGMAVKYTLRLEFAFPEGNDPVTNTVIAGNLTAIGLGGRVVTAPVPTKDRADGILSGLARSYVQRWDEADDELAALFRVVPVRPTVSACFVMS